MITKKHAATLLLLTLVGLTGLVNAQMCRPFCRDVLAASRYMLSNVLKIPPRRDQNIAFVRAMTVIGVPFFLISPLRFLAINSRLTR